MDPVAKRPESIGGNKYMLEEVISMALQQDSGVGVGVNSGVGGILGSEDGGAFLSDSPLLVPKAQLVRS